MRTRLVGDGFQVCNPSLAAELSGKCESEDDQPITAEWLKEQGWVQDDKGIYNPEHQDIEWRSKCRKLIIEAESRTIGLNGVRTRNDLLTLIRLIEGGEQ